MVSAQPSNVTHDNTGTVTSTVIIGKTCGITSDGTISYGMILSGDITAQKTLSITNTGNAHAEIKVSGTNWIDHNNNKLQMKVDSTKYSVSSSSEYSTNNSLSKNPDIIIPSLAPQSNTDTFWQLQVNLLDGSFACELIQIVEFSSVC